MEFSWQGMLYGVYVIVAIVVAVLSIRILRRDARERAERDAETAERILLEQARTKAHHHVVEVQEESREASGLPVAEVTEITVEEFRGGVHEFYQRHQPSPDIWGNVR